MKANTPPLQQQSISVSSSATEASEMENRIREEAELKSANRQLHAPRELFLTIAFLGDLLVILAALYLGFWSRFVAKIIPFGAEVITERQFSDYLFLILIGAIFLLFSFLYLKLYDPRNLLRYNLVASIIVKGTLVWLFAYLAISLILKFQPNISRIYAITSFVFVLIGLLVWRRILQRVMENEFFAKRLRQKVVFIGWNNEAIALEAGFRNEPSEPYETIGCLPAPRGTFMRPPPPHVPILGEYHKIEVLLKQRLADLVVLADLHQPNEEIVKLSNLCETTYTPFKIIPSFFQILISGLQLETISGVPILGVTELPLDRFGNRLLKRGLDVIGAIVGIILSLPIFLVCGVMIYLESPGPVVFAQERIGRRGRIFRMYKLRSMHLGAEETDHIHQSTPREDARMLRCGRFMRAWNLDEIVQFWNVLGGDMSLVGPRPERVYHSMKLSQTIPHYCARNFSTPGITGWAQVNGFRGGSDLEARVRCDIYYLENWTIWLDIRILVRTFLTRKNAY